MRELKFRYPVRDKKGNITEIRYWGCFLGRFHSFVGYEGEVVNLMESQQFTGLIDKTGTAIFEGDLVKFFTRSTRNKGIISEVKMCESGRWLPFNADDYIQDEQGDWFISEKGFEIIGNIYENPELLNQ